MKRTEQGDDAEFLSGEVVHIGRGRRRSRAKATTPPTPAELELAEELAKEMRPTWRIADGVPYEFDGTRWVKRQPTAGFERARVFLRGLHSAGRVRDREAAARTVGALWQLVKSHALLAVDPSCFDADDWLLNTPTSAVDLRTGEVRANRPEDLCSRSTAVGPAEGLRPGWTSTTLAKRLEVEAPAFVRFLREFTCEDVEMQVYLQRLAGYFLTGSTKEHAIAFVYGKGANGKSVLQRLFAGLFDSYATHASMEVFTTAGLDRHPAELAALAGARLVLASETEEGRPWAEARVKSLTGGDRVSARFMRGNPFEFTPKFKLFLAGNYQPNLRSVGEAERRRFHLIPAEFQPDRVDTELSDRLIAEGSWILEWAIAGCRSWQESGLTKPPRVAKATEAYFIGQDLVGEFLDEHTTAETSAFELSAAVYSRWKGYCEAEGETPGGKRRFTERLAARGFRPEKLSGGQRAIRGLKLR